MSANNSTTQVGNITSEPELKFTPSGQAALRFSLANNRRWQDRDTNEWKEETDFFNVQIWGKLAENVAETFSKGDRVIVVGRLRQESWEDKDTKQKRSMVLILADEVGPSLKWATAVVTRNPKGEGGGAKSAAEPPAGFEYDEEPF